MEVHPGRCDVSHCAVSQDGQVEAVSRQALNWKKWSQLSRSNGRELAKPTMQSRIHFLESQRKFE
jgi:hypothetical protein